MQWMKWSARIDLTCPSSSQAKIEESGNEAYPTHPPIPQQNQYLWNILVMQLAPYQLLNKHL
jgi:hypothetical protein